MKTYEVITYDDGLQILKVAEGEQNWFAPMTEENPLYQEYLRYTEWVEAGNNPDEFWTQADL
jgi:hypothetical protein